MKKILLLLLLLTSCTPPEPPKPRQYSELQSKAVASMNDLDRAYMEDCYLRSNWMDFKGCIDHMRQTTKEKDCTGAAVGGAVVGYGVRSILK